MKKIICFITFIFFSINVFAQNPITPNGKEVSAATLPDLTQNDIDYINNQIATNFPYVITIQSPQPYFGRFNCHFFAWHNNQGYTIWNGSGNIWQNGTPPQYKWFNYPTDYFSDGSYSNPSGYASYVQTTESTAPIAVYRSGGTIEHSARRLSGSTELISKWGAWGVYQHEPTEVPAIYGSITEKYKINPNYRPVGTGDPGGRNWGTISNALSGILPNSAVTVYSTAQTLGSNTTIPSGITLKLNSGSTINLNGYSIISTGGTINKEAGATINGLRASLTANLDLRGLCGSVQAAASAANQDNEITLEDGNFNENVTIYNKSDLTIYGGSLDYTPLGQLSLIGCNYFLGTGFGAKNLYFSNCNYALISNIYVDGIDQITTGLYLYNSDADISNTVATYSQAGISCYDGTEADIRNSALTYNLRGLEAYNGSNADIDTSWFCGTALDLKGYNFSTIHSYYCYFDGGTPSISQSSSTIQHVSDQTCSYSKINASQQIENSDYVVSTNDNSNSDFEKINSTYFDINHKLINDLKAKATFNSEAYCSEYGQVISDYKNFIENYPDAPLSKIALIATAHSYRRMDELNGKSDFIDMKNFLTDFIENKKYPALIPEAEKLMIDYYRLTDNFSEAVKMADNLIEKYKEDTNYVCSAIFSKD